jgi:hypothetical protein
MRTALMVVVCAGGIAGLSASTLAGGITPGNLVVYRIGNGTNPLDGAANAVFIDEYTTGGTLVQSIPMPTAVSGANKRLTNRGNGTSEGSLNMSADGRFITFAGYDADVGTASVGTTTSSAVNRVVGRLDLAGNVDTSTSFSAAFSGNAVRSAVTIDGSNFWVSGGNSGVQYVPFGNAGASNQLTSVGPTNLRNIGIANGQLYASSASGAGTQGILAVGTGLPTATGQTAALLSNFSSNLVGPPAVTGSMYDFYFANATTAYVADDSATTLGGLQKWTFDGTSWNRNAVFIAGLASGARIRQLTGTTDGSGNTLLYATTEASGVFGIVSFTDVGPSSSFSAPIATASTLNAFRGIELVVPAPGAATLLGIGMLAIARRRR